MRFRISKLRKKRGCLLIYTSLMSIKIATVVLFLFREFRNAFFEILHYNNCKCGLFSSKRHIRTSISKSNHSMNTKITPPYQSRQTSMIPSTQRNGCVSSSSRTNFQALSKTDSTDTFEMQIFAPQRPTLEAFDELEHLVSNGTSERASIVQMNSIIAEPETPSTNNEKRKSKRWKLNHHS